MDKIKKIVVVGLGYIGLPTAAVIASRKVAVLGVDINSNTIDTINQGKIHIVEPELDILVHATVSEQYLRAATIPEPADVFLIAVPTPMTEDHEADLSCIEAACATIASVLKEGDLVILESTSPVGTTEKVSRWLKSGCPNLSFPHEEGDSSDIRIAYCPERVLPGHVLRELIQNDRIIGGMTQRCSQSAVEFYKLFVEGECVITNSRTAEMCKLTENSYRDVNIAFANELSLICDRLDISVWELIQLANRHPRVNILRPGAGVGGHCLAVDPWFIVGQCPEEAQLIRTGREVNDKKMPWVINKVKEALASYLSLNSNKNPKNVVISCFGVSFKPDTDDLRESPALRIVSEIANYHQGLVFVVEPNISHLPVANGNMELVNQEVALKMGDIKVFLVNHKEFKLLPKPEGIYVDVQGLWDC